MNKIIMIQKTIAILSCIALLGCKGTTSETNRKMELNGVSIIQIEKKLPLVVDIERAKSATNKTVIDLVNSISYIHLDDEELIGEITKMIVTKDNIYILDSFVAQQIFVFDKKGKFIFSIKDKGQGAEEFISLWDMQVDTLNREILVNDALTRSRIYYSTENGEFIRREKGIANCYLVKNNEHYINLLANGQDFNEEENWTLLITNKDSILYKGFSMEPIQEGDYITNSLCFDSNGELLYTPINSDTIYQFMSDSLFSPKYVIRQKKSVWSKKKFTLTEREVSKLIKNENYTRFQGKFITSSRFAFFNIQNAWEGRIVNKPFFWDKQLNIVYEWNNTKPETIEDIIIFPLAIYGNTFYGAFSPVKEILQEYGKTLNPKLKNILEEAKNDSNPILVLYELHE